MARSPWRRPRRWPSVFHSQNSAPRSGRPASRLSVTARYTVLQSSAYVRHVQVLPHQGRGEAHHLWFVCRLSTCWIVRVSEILLCGCSRLCLFTG
jgi:hypothetical protein